MAQAQVSKPAAFVQRPNVMTPKKKKKPLPSSGGNSQLGGVKIPV